MITGTQRGTGQELEALKKPAFFETQYYEYQVSRLV